ncbi:EpsD family peptidyl-prolyl cis-trans isomerase [Pseudoduganella chitinolytica]|uniref:peptidylprolyl isomerase n=1 Tax=Pseudoduganella chitinolytica TaxID=34070 RepID=A0ABY8BL51_9BURK|nr:EpsD family peptidyl-prolyl cis-trans isomerase [Pseudoduganella chitinolytica]WEF35683.1 EpsD family peptidyl-prolyl cis-trans isomerase [Pseudoduganella chitinolytica]
MKHSEQHSLATRQGQYSHRRVLSAGLLVLAAAVLSACGEKAEKKQGQALASVNGEEITVLQLNEELTRVNPQMAQQEAARKQLLEALIDRQLLQSEAAKEKIDRDPKVVQAIERAKATIVAQAYLQKRIGTVARPTKAEVEAYYNQNPQFFSNRKQLDMRQLVLATADVTEEVKRAIDSAKSLEEVAAWLDEHKVKYGRAQLSRSTTELPPELSARLQAMPKGQLFIIREGARSMLISINEIKDAPVTLEQASGQIEQFLFNKKNKEAAEAAVKQLRSTAKIEYMNQPAAAAAPAAAATTPAAPAADKAGASEDATARGVAGLK